VKPFNPQEWADELDKFAKRAFETWKEWNDESFNHRR